MKWYETLYRFWVNNLERNVKRLSIAFGAFLIVIITTCSLPTPLFLASIYGAGITFGTMVIMSIFGKNGNGQEIEPEPEPEPEVITENIETEIKEAITETVAVKKITLP